MTLSQMVQALKEKFADSVLQSIEFRNEQTLHIAFTAIPAVLKYCRDELAFDFLVDISALDHLGEEPRFEMVYELYGMSHHCHLRIRSKVPDGESVPSVTSIWKTADWHEREAWDMMGIHFSGHPNLKRILMWEGYPYFPLRKDFPLAGKPSDLPEVGFTRPAPMADGPFVTSAGAKDTVAREPRAKHVD